MELLWAQEEINKKHISSSTYVIKLEVARLSSKTLNMMRDQILNDVAKADTKKLAAYLKACGEINNKNVYLGELKRLV